MVFNLNAVAIGEGVAVKPSPEDLAELEAMRPAGCGIPIPKMVSKSGLYEVACKMSHSCIPSCNCEAGVSPMAVHLPNCIAALKWLLSLPHAAWYHFVSFFPLPARPKPHVVAQGVEKTSQVTSRPSGLCATSWRARSSA